MENLPLYEKQTINKLKKVLVVDDDIPLLNVIDIILTQYGFETALADCSEQMQFILKKERPEIILLDVMLENSDGRKICRQIKEDPELNNICIILLSSIEENVRDHKVYKADGAITKPFNIQKLLKTLDECQKSKIGLN